MFIGWFFLCIVLTIAQVMPVANIEHGVGAVLGMLLGLAAAGDRDVKWKSRAALAGLLAVIFLGATVFWPWVNLSANAEPKIEQAALAALDRKDVAHGVKLLEIATQRRNAPARAWYNLGVALGRAGRFDEAIAAWQHGAQLPDADEQIMKAAQSTKPVSMESNTNR